MSPGQRVTAAEQAVRVNAAARLLDAGLSVAAAARRLERRYRVSERQARRYVEQARDGGPTEVPKPKAVFTVKLPLDLVRRLKTHARRSQRTLSSLVAQALDEFLSRVRAGPRSSN